MNHEQMISRVLDMKIAENPDEAPNYTEEFKLVKLDKAIVVCQGTVEGNPTVDLQMSDAAGNKYLIMATGGIIEALGIAVRTKREMTNPQPVNTQ